MKVSALPADQQLNLTDRVLIDDEGGTKTATIQQLKDALGSGESASYADHVILVNQDRDYADKMGSYYISTSTKSVGFTISDHLILSQNGFSNLPDNRFVDGVHSAPSGYSYEYLIGGLSSSVYRTDLSNATLSDVNHVFVNEISVAFDIRMQVPSDKHVYSYNNAYKVTIYPAVIVLLRRYVGDASLYTVSYRKLIRGSSPICTLDKTSNAYMNEGEYTVTGSETLARNSRQTAFRAGNEAMILSIYPAIVADGGETKTNYIYPSGAYLSHTESHIDIAVESLRVKSLITWP